MVGPIFRMLHAGNIRYSVYKVPLFIALIVLLHNSSLYTGSLNLSMREWAITLLMLRLLHPKHNGAKIFQNYLNPVMLVFIGKLFLSTFR